MDAQTRIAIHNGNSERPPLAQEFLNDGTYEVAADESYMTVEVREEWALVLLTRL